MATKIRKPIDTMNGIHLNIDISVIIPVFNARTTLERCVDSVLCQKGNFNYEIILIDDGSDDGSGSLIDSMAARKTKIRAIHQVNAGPGAARNAGMRVAFGRYLVFVDSDDYVSSCYLKHLYEAKAYDENMLVISGIVKCVANNKELIDSNESQRIDMRTRPAWLDDLRIYDLAGPYAKLFDFQIIRQHAILFPESIKCGEDLIFLLHYLTYVNTVQFINHCSYYYQRTNTSSLTHSNHSFDVEYAGYSGLNQALTAYMNTYNVQPCQIPKMHDWIKLFVLRTIKSSYRRGEHFVSDKNTRLSLLNQLHGEAQLRAYMRRKFAPNFLDRWTTTFFMRRHLRLLDLFLNLFFRLRGLKIIDMYLEKTIK